ncbi:MULTISPECIES: hypothetical protein [unclassified Streptomyces]|uniref:hypothetical protein n=1 Tax=unclassified Streptomyces TaxID=2593676 RepID=UPI002254A4D8|nr:MULTISPECIES: hypothetical protein [unclassified Streptomyces]MCX4398671.1 hypothetical protein [Streptomyces sp. NBC_01767]WSP50972.1 hypothetical protein OG348_36840 [Streptomyces sp. NBC_01243]
MEQKIFLTLEVDTQGDPAHGRGHYLADVPGLRIEIIEKQQGHGFGLAEVITISVAIGTGMASDLAASAIRGGIAAIIRRVKSSRGESDGTESSIAELIDRERGSHGAEQTPADSTDEAV